MGRARSRNVLPALALMLVLAGSDGVAQDPLLNSNLLTAATANDNAAIEALLGAGADPNARDSDGRTALFWAASLDNVAAIAAMLAAGADVNATDSDGNGPGLCRR